VAWYKIGFFISHGKVKTTYPIYVKKGKGSSYDMAILHNLCSSKQEQEMVEKTETELSLIRKKLSEL
jgi:hypothetical protein